MSGRKQKPSPEHTIENSLHPHKVWLLWDEDATEAQLILDEAEIERCLDVEVNQHIAEYTLTRSELVNNESETS